MAFKPNIYPIMYWALAYGIAAALLLFLVFLLAQYIVVAWAPVFLTGILLGAFRNYRKQKNAWLSFTGQQAAPQGFVDEMKNAVTDIASASQEMIEKEQQENDTPATSDEQSQELQYDPEEPLDTTYDSDTPPSART